MNLASIEWDMELHGMVCIWDMVWCGGAGQLYTNGVASVFIDS